MALSSGNSSTSTSTKFQSSGSEQNLQLLMDERERKNKRKLSNRESARRSRMRKQNHLDDLMRLVSHLTEDNNEILTNINITTHHYLNVEAENSILRAQLVELNQRFQSLNDIINLINTTTGAYENDCYLTSSENFMNPMNVLFLNQPITASADIFQW